MQKIPRIENFDSVTSDVQIEEEVK